MNTPTRRSLLLALAASGILAACGSDSGGRLLGSTTVPSKPGSGTLTPINHSYARTAADPNAPTSNVVAADRALTAKLFGLIATAEAANFIVSPYSIATAFSMAEAGAENETKQEMRTALGIDGPDDQWHAGRNAVDQLISLEEVSDGADPFELEITNTPFGQAGFEFLDAFIQLLAEEYGADLITVDFRANPEAARLLINRWVADQTRERILDLLPEGSIDGFVRLVLVNTVFFKAQWINEFDPERTSRQEFALLDGSTVEVDLMTAGVRTTYGEGDGWRMVRLPYWGGYSMVVLLPDPGRFDEISDQISNGLLDEVSALRTDFQIDLSLPKFEFATPTDLKPIFEALGMQDAFDPGKADFSAVTGTTDLYISGAYHQATIEVDEYGTTASAATAIVMSTTSAPPPATFRADRPFVFTIEHDESGEPLFIGRVLDPTL